MNREDTGETALIHRLAKVFTLCLYDNCHITRTGTENKQFNKLGLEEKKNGPVLTESRNE